MKRLYLIVFQIVTSTTAIFAATSDTDGDSGATYSLIVGMVVILIIAALLTLGFFVSRRKSALNKIPAGTNKTHNEKVTAEYRLQHPDFDENDFTAKVETLFHNLQKIKQNHDLSTVRQQLSNGMLQRYIFKIKMMNILAQSIDIESITMKHATIDDIETDGDIDIITVSLCANVVETVKSTKYASINGEHNEEFIEYWSFVKNNASPNWVLYEITQADDYVITSKLRKLSKDVAAILGNDNKTGDHIVSQLLEDNVGNAYMQIQAARVTHDLAPLRKFLTVNCLDKISNAIGQASEFMFYKLNLNDVTLVGAMKEAEKHVLVFTVKTSTQRVAYVAGDLEFVDNIPMAHNEFLFLERNLGSTAKGSLYSGQCPACGHAIADNDIECSVCHHHLNSPDCEWIIADIMNDDEYSQFYKSHKDKFAASVDPIDINSAYSTRDFAFNNVLVMIAADGVFEDEELVIAKNLAKKWGYSSSKLQGLFNMAKNNQLTVRMPQDKDIRQKIYSLMCKVASADGNIAAEEKKLLNDIKRNYL